MRIEVKYSKSEGPHLIDITLEDINHMQGSGQLERTYPTTTGTKTLTISGTREEFAQMAQLLQTHANI